MKNITLVSMKTNNSYEDILNMPYITLLSFCHYVQEFEIESYRMQAEMFSAKKSNNSNATKKHQTEPDWSAIRKTGGVI